MRKRGRRKNKEEENAKRHFDLLFYNGLGHETEQRSKQQRGCAGDGSDRRREEGE